MEKKFVVVTGATRGIGKAAAAHLVEAGYGVVVHGATVSTVRETVEDLQECHPGASLRGCWADFSKLDQVNALARAISSLNVPVVALVNNAASIRSESDEVVPRNIISDSRLWVNAVSPLFLMCRMLQEIPSMKRVVNVTIGSEVHLDPAIMEGIKGVVGVLPYYYSKALMGAWSKYVGENMVCRGVDVLAMSPGIQIHTRLSEAVSDSFWEGPQMPGRKVADLAVGDSYSGMGGKFFRRDLCYSGEELGGFRQAPPSINAPGVAKGVTLCLRDLIVGAGFSCPLPWE